MLRLVHARVAVLLCVLLGGPRLFAAEQFLFTDEPNTDAEAWLVSQPSAEEAPSAAAPRATRSSARSSYARLARAPNMYGDSFGNAGQLGEQGLFGVPLDPKNTIFFKGNPGIFVDLPPIGGGGTKVAENNKSLPADRVYFNYNGFQNAITVGQPVPRDSNLNHYTAGFEKTFFDGQWSVNFALPFTNRIALNTDAFSLGAGHLGNVSVFLKHLAYSNDEFAVSSGLGVRLPTGSDLTGQTHQRNELTGRIDRQTLVIQNQAVHLVPYVGFLSAPSDNWFVQGFMDVDLAANGNAVDLGTPAQRVGLLTEQNLFHLDLSAGRWIYQNPEATYFTGAAAVIELHYTSTIQDADRFALPTNPFNGPYVNGEFRNLANRTDVLNLTSGVQFQIGYLSNLRVACVVPVRNQPNRQFDSEIQVSFNRFF